MSKNIDTLYNFENIKKSIEDIVDNDVSDEKLYRVIKSINGIVRSTEPECEYDYEIKSIKFSDDGSARVIVETPVRVYHIAIGDC